MRGVGSIRSDSPKQKNNLVSVSFRFFNLKAAEFDSVFLFSTAGSI
jgi:hypothetical protein